MKSRDIKFIQEPDGQITVDCEQWTDGQELSEFLDRKGRNGSHLVEIQNDLPKPVPPSPVPRDSPRTLQEVYTQVYRRDIDHLEKAVGQLLVAGNVTNVRCQTLLAHLRELETEFYRLHLELQKTLIDKLRLADEEVAGKK